MLHVRIIIIVQLFTCYEQVNESENHMVYIANDNLNKRFTYIDTNLLNISA